MPPKTVLFSPELECMRTIFCVWSSSQRTHNFYTRPCAIWRFAGCTENTDLCAMSMNIFFCSAWWDHFCWSQGSDRKQCTKSIKRSHSITYNREPTAVLMFPKRLLQDAADTVLLWLITDWCQAMLAMSVRTSLNLYQIIKSCSIRKPLCL